MWNIFRNEYSERQRQLFADQFESKGGGFVYRKGLKGPAIPVTAAERQCFIDDYDRRWRYSVWIIIVGLALVTIGLVWWSFVRDADFPDVAGYIAIGTVAAISVGYMVWAWGAPARELQPRTPVSGERSREDVKRRMLARTSYGHLTALAFGGAVLPFTLRSHPDLLHGWGRLWLVYSAVVILTAGLAAFRKWRFEREGD